MRTASTTSWIAWLAAAESASSLTMRVVGGGVGDPVEAVGRQSGHVLLLLLPSSAVPGVGGEDDQRLPVQAGQGRGLLHRGVGFDELVDEAVEVAGQRRVGARLVLNAAAGGCRRRPGRSAVRRRGERPRGPARRRDRGRCRGDARQGWARLGCGGVQEHQAGDVVRELRGEALDVQAAERVAGEHVGPGNVARGRAGCAGRRRSAHRPAARRRRRSSLDRRGRRRRPWCRGRRPARSRRGRRRPRPDPVPGRRWGSRSRCSSGAAGARRRRPAGRAPGRPWRRGTRGPSRSRRRRRRSPARPGRDTATTVRFGCATAVGPGGTSRPRARAGPAATPSRARSRTAADPTSRATPTTAMNTAGAAAHRCGWSVNRTDSTANIAQPSAKPSRTIPVSVCSSAGAIGAATRRAAAISPAAIEPATINPILLRAVCGGRAGDGRWLGSVSCRCGDHDVSLDAARCWAGVSCSIGHLAGRLRAASLRSVGREVASRRQVGESAA